MTDARERLREQVEEWHKVHHICEHHLADTDKALRGQGSNLGLLRAAEALLAEPPPDPDARLRELQEHVTVMPVMVHPHMFKANVLAKIDAMLAAGPGAEQRSTCKDDLQVQPEAAPQSSECMRPVEQVWTEAVVETLRLEDTRLRTENEALRKERDASAKTLFDISQALREADDGMGGTLETMVPRINDLASSRDRLRKERDEALARAAKTEAGDMIDALNQIIYEAQQRAKAAEATVRALARLLAEAGKP